VEILGDILDSEPSGRLYKALVESKKATNVSVRPSANHDPGSIEIMAEVNTKDLSTLEKIRDAMFSVTEEVGRSGVTQEETDRARQRILKNRELAAADPNRIAVQLSEWGAQGDWRLYFINRDRIEKVTPEQVKNVAEKYFTTSNRTVGFFVPTSKPERTPVPPVPDIAKLVDGYTGRQQPKDVSSETTDVAPLAIEARVQRPEPIAGVKLAFLPKKTRNESVQMLVTLHYGNESSLKGFSEAAGFLAQLMLRGTKSLNRQQIQDALDKNFVRLGTGGNMRMMRGAGGGAGTITFTIETKRANLPAALDILRQVLREPSLPGSEFEVMKNEQIAGIEQGRSDPMRQGFNHIQRLVSHYPADDVRYVPTLDEQVERVRKTSLDQVATLYRDYLGADHGELVIVGDFEPSEMVPILAKIFDGWKSQQPYARIERPFQRDVEPKRETVATPDKENAVFLGALSLPIKDDDPDYPALVAGNFILGGGGLSSRLADRLRQKEGLSYGAMSMFLASPLDPRADLMIMAIYNPTNLDKVVSGVDDEFSRLVKDGAKTAELDQAKVGWIEDQSLQRTRDMPLASQLATNLFTGRTMQFQADLEQKVKALTPEIVNAAIKKHLDPKRLSAVTAGDFKKK
jgi:zinc protease